MGLSISRSRRQLTTRTPAKASHCRKAGAKTVRQSLYHVGLNELGTGTTESWAQTYADVISQIRQAQPNAIIYLQSILVVAASQDNPGGAINNATVNARNQALEALANPQDNIYYLNVNEAVMDANGCLDASLTSDGIHLLGNSLSLWEDYLKQHAIVPGGTGTAATTLTTYTTAVTNTPAAQ
ncbi:MAG: GDSL-type esterase/lipase family protein [Ruminococcus sp.]